MPSNFYRYYLNLLACPVHSPTSTMPVNPLMFSGNLQFLALRSLKKKAICINSVLGFLTLTSNEEGSRFWYKNHTVSLEKYWLTFIKPLYVPKKEEEL